MKKLLRWLKIFGITAGFGNEVDDENPLEESKAEHLRKAGDADPACALWEPLLPLIEGVFAEPNPGPLKAVMGLQGWIADELRSPMTRASQALGERLQALEQQLG